MNVGPDKNCPHADLATLFVIGDLDSRAASDFDAHRRQCETCCREVEYQSAAYDDVVRGIELDAPPELANTLRQRITRPGGSPILSVLSAATAKSGGTHSHDDAADSSSYYILRQTREEAVDGWEATDVAGVRVRKLLVQEEEGRMTCLVRMEPGARYPAHVHAGHEECFVLEGDLRTDSSTMYAGDYEHAPQGSRHGIQDTEGGCLLLIHTSLYDEFAA